MKKILPIFKFIILLLGMLLFFYIPIELFHINYNNLTNKMKILYNLSCDIGYMIIIFTIYYKDILNNFKTFFKNIKNNLKISIKYYSIGLFFMFITNIIISTIFPIATANNEENIKQLISIYPLYMFFSVAIYAPFVEEIIFRKSIKDIFLPFNNNNIKKYTYIITSGFIFALMHIIGQTNSYFDFLYLIPYMTVGLAFAKIYTDTDNIFNTIIFHSLHNTVSIIIYLLLGV